MRAQRLLHIHIPSCGRSPLYPPYTIASQLQEHLRRRQLDFKDATASASASANASAADTDTTHANDWPPTGVTGHYQTPPGPHPPPPTVVSFTPMPTYTLGRRQTTPLSEAELARLQAPLLIENAGKTRALPVTVLPSPRGGLTTYHGPGQIVLWPVMDLRSPYHKQFTVRCYSRLLETTTIAALAKLTILRGTPLIQGFTNEEPGVWVNQLAFPAQEVNDITVISTMNNWTQYWLNQPESRPRQQEAKIAALGVHLRRHISALGTAINVDMPWPELRNEKINPWARFVPCGLEGKSVTSLGWELRVREMVEEKAQRSSQRPEMGVGEDSVPWRNIVEKVIGEGWVDELSAQLGCDGVDRMPPREVAELVMKIYEPSEGQNLELEKKYLEWLQNL